jgi:predicted nuclease of predicted toxin-antitoxin system
LLFDELLPPQVAVALNVLGFRTSHVGNVDHKQPPRGSSDAEVLKHAMATGQVVVTSNHDMIILCAERGQPVVWIDPRGRQFRHDQLAFVAFGGIANWHRALSAADSAICIRVLRTKFESISLDRARALAERRMRVLRTRQRHRGADRAQADGDLLGRA